MDNLFGIPMTTIMFVLVAVLCIALASVAFIAVTNRHMFLMGLRNLPRRGLQTGLVVVGLMLATLITTAAFVTGDTVNYSIEKAGYEALQRVDLSINFQGDQSSQASASQYAPALVTDDLERRFGSDPDIDGFLPLLLEPGAAANERTRLSEPRVTIAGVDAIRLDRIGGLRLVGGGTAHAARLGSGDAYVTRDAARELDAAEGDTIVVHVREQATPLRVIGIVEDELASSGLNDIFSASSGGGVVVQLAVAQEITGHPDQINFLGVALEGGVSDSYRASDEVAARLEPFVQSSEAAEIFGVPATIQIDTLKQDAVDEAESLGNMFTTFFLVLGLFSIASGVMLIFMIFVMLAAERKAEMGMARAVGAQRTNLVQAFVSEGMAYNLIAGAVGAAAGVAAALGLVVGYLKWAGGDDFSFVTGHVTWQALIVSYCLGVALTFVTVVLASIKVTSVNIVAAIRGLDEGPKRAARRKINWKWTAIGIPALVVPPLGVWLLFRKGLGVPWTWIIAPAGMLVAAPALLGARGGGSMSEFLAGFGFSVLPLSFAMIATHHGAPFRAVWTLVGVWMAFYWMAPFSVAEKLLRTDVTGDIEMFVLSGVMVVIAFTLIIVFNARLLTTLFQRRNGHKYRKPAGIAAAAIVLAAAGAALGDRADGAGEVLYVVAGLLGIAALASWSAVRFPAAAPAFKMGVAYPLANSFRTGMTIAMFSLIVFSIVTFSAVNANFSSMLTGENGDGGWDIVTTASRNTPVDDIVAALRDRDAAIAQGIDASGRTTTFTGSQQLEDGDAWVTYPVIGADSGFFTAENAKLDARARGFDSERAVLDAVAADPSLALVDATTWGPYDFTWSITKSGGEFDPFPVTYRNPLTGRESTVTVVGVLGSRLYAEIAAGLYVNEQAYADVFGAPVYDRTYLHLSGGDAEETARTIESALSVEGVQADGIRALIDADAAQDRAFTRMFQAFMALGLVVGIVALGVISFRSVVERRQQIGMLRAIGYQTETVALTFVLESAFIAMMGILSGVVGGVIVSRNLFTTGQFSGEGIEFMMPWSEVLVFTAAALVVALLMTWWPSRNAAKVPVADALRYE